MIVHALTAALALSVAGADAAHPELSLFGQLQKYCIATGANAQTAAKLAEADGFKRIVDTDASHKGDDLDGMTHAVALQSEHSSVVAGEKGPLYNDPGVKIEECSIVAHGDVQPVKDEARAWVGLAPAETTANTTLYVFIAAPGGAHRPLEKNTSESDRAKLLKSGALQSISISDTSGDLLVIFGVSRPTT